MLQIVLMKSGGRMIYCGSLGQHSSKLIEYFEVSFYTLWIQNIIYIYILSLHISWMKSLQAIPGVPRIRNNYNPATWMLEVTSTSSEVMLGIDFADIYSQSALYE